MKKSTKLKRLYNRLVNQKDSFKIEKIEKQIYTLEKTSKQ